MNQPIRGNAVVGQSGGPTAVTNQSLIGVIEAVKECDRIDRLLGARHGVRGIVGGEFIDLKGLDAGLLEKVAATPGAALLRTSRPSGTRRSFGQSRSPWQMPADGSSLPASARKRTSVCWTWVPS